MESWKDLETQPATICDPFFGSGTTGYVAQKFGRVFIGIDLSKQYIDDIAIPRIVQAMQQRSLF